MAVQIELLAVSRASASVALYYPVPVGDQIADAADPARTPAGSRLSAGEITALQDGELTELVGTFSLSGMSKAQAKAYIESLWSNRQAEALRTYATRFRDADLVGKAFDGSSWS